MLFLTASWKILLVPRLIVIYGSFCCATIVYFERIGFRRASTCCFCLLKICTFMFFFSIAEALPLRLLGYSMDAPPILMSWTVPRRLLVS